MTIDAYMFKFNIKRKETVIKWILNGYIPGADLNNNYIPDSARQPYINARAKSAKSIYCSIVKATQNLYHVCAQLYNICDDEFNGYISRLVDAQLIVIRITDGLTYYDAPIKNKCCTKKFILEAIESCSSGLARGTISALV